MFSNVLYSFTKINVLYIFTVGNLQNIFMEHDFYTDFWYKIKVDNFDPYNCWLLPQIPC